MPQGPFDCRITFTPPAQPGALPTFVFQPASTDIPWGLGQPIVWTLALGAGCPGTAGFSQAGVVLDSRWRGLHPQNPGPVRVSDSVWTLAENNAGDSVDTQRIQLHRRRRLHGRWRDHNLPLPAAWRRREPDNAAVGMSRDDDAPTAV